MMQSASKAPSQDIPRQIKDDPKIQLDRFGPQRCNCCKKKTVMPVFWDGADSICWWCLKFDRGGVGGHA